MKTISLIKVAVLLLAGVLPTVCSAGTYTLEIAKKKVNLTGKTVEKMAINGQIPGPTLHFKEGEQVTIHVTNKMDVPTSVHWHGMLVPAEMDGVPGLNGFMGIMPGQTFTYTYTVRQNGTYWYHSHSQLQEQEGLYGSLVVSPKGEDPVKADRDYVVVLSDFTDESGDDVLGHLKADAGYYNYAKRTLADFFHDVRKKGWSAAWADRKAWGQMRMDPTDIADVSGYTFLMNGKTPDQNWTGIFKPGERVRLRFINASAMSFYDVWIPGLKMQVVQADGRGVEPVQVDEFRFGVAETYDVIVQPQEEAAYTIAAESVDRSGFAIGTLAPREGMHGPQPEARPRTLLTMADMGMTHDMDGMDMAGMDMAGMEGMGGMHDMHHMHGMHHAMPAQKADDVARGWADASTPQGHKALSYADLRSLEPQSDVRPPEREILVTLGGNMERYVWTINGEKFEKIGPIELKYGERVRLKFVNETMMAHPMHLHGMFVQLENGQPAGRLPDKHTIIVPPGQSYSVLLTADEPGEWAFHCHLLYHMASGMMTKAVVARLSEDAVPEKLRKKVKKTEAGEGHSHAH
ncbi:MAG: copper resistance system multicopper oxidase [Proteobacteria bacterium]|nr:copper resistance system multicopper oxidase [Pseudomonadota bacterium]